MAFLIYTFYNTFHALPLIKILALEEVDCAFLLFLCKINIDALHVLRLEESVFKANHPEERLAKLKEPKETVFNFLINVML